MRHWRLLVQGWRLPQGPGGHVLCALAQHAWVGTIFEKVNNSGQVAQLVTHSLPLQGPSGRGGAAGRHCRPHCRDYVNNDSSPASAGTRWTRWCGWSPPPPTLARSATARSSCTPWQTLCGCESPSPHAAPCSSPPSCLLLVECKCRSLACMPSLPSRLAKSFCGLQKNCCRSPEAPW